MFIELWNIYIAAGSCWFTERLTETEVRATVAAERLLDAASDGLCTVDCATSVIELASPKLHATFGSSALEGTPLIQRITDDDQGRLEELLKSASRGEMNPVLLTCVTSEGGSADERSISKVADDKIIPYSVSSRRMDLCVQIMGESRCVELPAPATRGPPVMVEGNRYCDAVSSLDGCGNGVDAMSSLAFTFSQLSAAERQRVVVSTTVRTEESGSPNGGGDESEGDGGWLADEFGGGGAASSLAFSLTQCGPLDEERAAVVNIAVQTEGYAGTR